MPRSDEEQAELDAEVRRRYDPEALVRRAGDIGVAMVDVIEAAMQLTLDQRRALHEGYEQIVPELRSAGLLDDWEKVFRYHRPFPEHPGDLYAIDPYCRAAFDFAVLVADTPLNPADARPDVPTTIGRSAAGMVMALTVDLAAREGWYHPVSIELARYLRRPWETVFPPAPAGAPSAPPPPAGAPASPSATASPAPPGAGL